MPKENSHSINQLCLESGNLSPPFLMNTLYFKLIYYNHSISYQTLKKYDMKKLFLLLTLTTAYSMAQCQLDKGVWLAGGSGDLYSYNEEYTAPSVNFTGKYRSLDLSASIGYFFANKLTGGLRPYLSIYRGKSSEGGSANDLKVAGGPFLRYYFLKEDKQFNLLADISYQFGINEARNGDNPKGKFNIFSIMAGIEAFFNSSIGLELLIGYKNQLATFDNSPSAYSSNRKGIQTSIGFQLHLQKN